MAATAAASVGQRFSLYVCGDKEVDEEAGRTAQADMMDLAPIVDNLQ